MYLSYDLERKNPSPVPLLPIPTIQTVKPSPSPVPAASVRSSVFVPYWALGKDNLASLPEETLYYFGVAVDKNGMVKNDPGYKALASLNCPQSKTCILVVRMLNSEDNLDILEHPAKQTEIASSLIALADKHSFSGLALDLEQSAILYDKKLQEYITQFVQLFYTSANKDYKTFSFIVYGDSYFRKRPYDIQKIAESSDEVMVMAYDFNKSYSEPGPNFPFDRSVTDLGYDFQKMTEDFMRDVPKDKLTVIFGMYGYDWTLNVQGTPLKRAEAITDNEIQKYLKGHAVTAVAVPSSREKKIEYRDADGQKHIIWYEDQESADVKIEYLRNQGVGSVSYWAYGYY